MYLITKWFGTFLCDEKGIQNKILFPKKEPELLNRLEKIQNNKILPEEKKIIKNKTVQINEQRLQPLGTYTENDPFFTKISINPEDYGYSQQLFQKISMKLAQKQVDHQLQSEDLQIIQMVNTFDDLIHTANLLSERLTSWSNLPNYKEKSKPLQHTHTTVQKETKKIEQQIETEMTTIAPNISHLSGSLIGARLIALAGGLQNLALMPASTIQILGAEKALFRYKKEGGKPPKHGVIYQHPLINRAPREKRGKIARTLATKIATAAKADAFTHRDISKTLKNQLEKRVQEIKNT